MAGLYTELVTPQRVRVKGFDLFTRETQSRQISIAEGRQHIADTPQPEPFGQVGVYEQIFVCLEREAEFRIKSALVIPYLIGKAAKVQQSRKILLVVLGVIVIAPPNRQFQLLAELNIHLAKERYLLNFINFRTAKCVIDQIGASQRVNGRLPGLRCRCATRHKTERVDLARPNPGVQPRSNGIIVKNNFLA